MIYNKVIKLPYKKSKGTAIRKDYSMQPAAIVYLEQMAKDRHGGNRSAMLHEMIMHFAYIEGYRIEYKPIYNDDGAITILTDLVENGGKMTPEFRQLLNQIVIAQYEDGAE